MLFFSERKKRQTKKKTGVCPILAEVWLNFGSLPILGYFLKSILFDKNMKINTDDIFFVQNASQ